MIYVVLRRHDTIRRFDLLSFELSYSQKGGRLKCKIIGDKAPPSGSNLVYGFPFDPGDELEFHVGNVVFKGYITAITYREDEDIRRFLVEVEAALFFLEK